MNKTHAKAKRIGSSKLRFKFQKLRQEIKADMKNSMICMLTKLVGDIPVSILYKSIAGRYRPVRVADGPITARYRFIKNASWD